MKWRDAWLQFDVIPAPGGGSFLGNPPFLPPRGVSGWRYWFGLYTMYAPIFSV